jgi:hypothetical protein
MDGSRVWFTVHGIRCTRVRGTGMRYTVRTRYMILSVQGTHTRYATRYRYTVYRHVHGSRYTAHRSRVCFTVSVDGSQSVHGEPQQTHVCMEIYSPSSTPPRLQSNIPHNGRCWLDGLVRQVMLRIPSNQVRQPGPIDAACKSLPCTQANLNL